MRTMTLHRVPAEYVGLVCQCGEAWFEITGPTPEELPAVVIRKDGCITGYSGVLRCASCHRLPDFG
jgi:hypothetical protein